MTEHICGIQMDVTCADGSSHQNVTLKIVGTEVIYETVDGLHLTGATKVTDIQAALYVCTPMELAATMLKYKEQEQ